jgi:hypothetical protein
MIGRREVLLAATALIAGGDLRTQARSDPGFRAIALLERRAQGTLPRVRFEWSRRPNAVEYLLSGSWAAGESWTIQRAEYRVTQKTATSWGPELVTFELSLPPGEYSWRLEPVRSPDGPGDSTGAARVGFDLR